MDFLMYPRTPAQVSVPEPPVKAVNTQSATTLCSISPQGHYSHKGWEPERSGGQAQAKIPSALRVSQPIACWLLPSPCSSVPHRDFLGRIFLAQGHQGQTSLFQEEGWKRNELNHTLEEYGRSFVVAAFLL